MNNAKQGGQILIACLFVMIGFACIMTSQSFAQTTTGSIFGTVSDNTGAIIPNATVTVTNVQTGINQTAQSNGSGNYIFPALVPGDYTVSTRSSGFSIQTLTGIHIDASQNANASFSLKVGSENQEITVEAAKILVDTRESQLADTIDEKRIEDLPLNGRDPYALVQLTPGITSYSAQPPIGSQNGTQFSTNGNRKTQNTTYLDGAYDSTLFSGGGNVLPNPDALQEFRILTSNFDAEYGRYPGAVVNAITRSGANKFHGGVHEYIRNSVLNAKSYFNPTVTPLKQNQFGGTVGGPIKRDKAFFFLSYEGLRINTPTILNGSSFTTLTPAEARGDFRQDVTLNRSGFTLPDPNIVNCNGVQYVICSNQLDPVVQNLINQGYLSLGDPSTGHPANQTASANTSQNQGLARVDYQLSHHLLSGTFFQSRGLQATPGIGGNQMLTYAGALTYASTTNIALNDVWTISANMLNTLRPFYTLNHYDQGNLYNKATWANLGSQITTAATPLTPPQFTVNGFFNIGLGASGPDNLHQTIMGVEDTFNWTKGNHTIKLGGAYLWSNFREHGEYFGTGLATFTGSVTKNALADFLLGKGTLRQNNGAVHALHVADPSLFAQDDWRITHKLTLDLGLRWEIFAPFTGENNVGTFRAGVQSQRFPTAPLGLLTAGDPGIPDGILKTNNLAFTPRVGFAYDIFGDGRMAIRGGYGIFYASRAAAQITNPEQQPFVVDLTTNNTPNLVNPYAPGVSPFPYTVNLANPRFVSGSTISSIPPNANFSYVYEYNLTLEQQLTSSMGMAIGYVGSATRKSYITRDINAPVYDPAIIGTPAAQNYNARRPYQPTPLTYTFAGIVSADEGNANYNSLQTTLTQNLKHGISYKASYTWAKSMDIASGEPANINLTLSNQYNPKADWGRSTFDIHHRFVASYLYEPPTIKRWGFVGRNLLSRWQFNGITTVSSGVPFTVTSGVDANLDNVSTDRPDQIGNPILPKGNLSQRVAQYFDPTAFHIITTSEHRANPYGNTHRSSLIGPGYVNTDFSGFKNFSVIKLPGSFQFRAEFFNLFNTVQLGNPSANLSSATVGKITSLASGSAPRVVQFALRYNF